MMEHGYAIYDKSTGKLAVWDYRMPVFWHKWLAVNAVRATSNAKSWEVRRVAINQKPRRQRAA